MSQNLPNTDHGKMMGFTVSTFVYNVVTNVGNVQNDQLFAFVRNQRPWKCGAVVISSQVE